MISLFLLKLNAFAINCFGKFLWIKKESLHENLEKSKINDLTVTHLSEKSPEFAARLAKYERFDFLSSQVKAVLAMSDLTVYDLKFLQAKEKKLSAFLQKEISIKSSVILTLWYSLFDLIYLTPNLFDKIDKEYTEMCFRKLCLKKMPDSQFMLHFPHHW